MQRNPWTTLRSALIYDNRWIRVDEHQVLTPKGDPGIYGTVHFKNYGIGILPIDRDGCTTLVGQFRYPLNRYSWEMPEGGGPLDIEPLASAKRELLEECGLVARHWLEILQMDLSNSVCDERAILFLAWDLVQDEASPDDTEQLQLRRLPFGEVVEMVCRGEITDAMSVAAILKLQLMLLTGEAPPEVAEAVAGACSLVR